MIAAPCRASLRAAMLLASLALGVSAPAGAMLLKFQSVEGSAPPAGGGGSATFTSVAATPLKDPTGLPPRAYASGHFSGQFRFNSAQTLNTQGPDAGVLAGLTLDPATGRWVTDWLLQAFSDGGAARITDVAISPTGGIYVTGIFDNVVTFPRAVPVGDLTFVATALGRAEGFVALADPNGNWIDAFQVPGMQPQSIALGPGDDIFLTGLPDLARRYSPLGNEIWKAPAPPGTISLRHIAVQPGTLGRDLFVLGRVDANPDDGAVDEDVFVARIDQINGRFGSRTSIAGATSEELPGGLGIDPQGGLRVSFSSTNSPGVKVDGVPLFELPAIAGRHSHLLFLDRTGRPVRDNLLGNSLAPGGEMLTTDLAIDYAGNAHVAVSFRGPFGFEGVPHGGQNDTAVVTVDAAGLAFRFTDTTGPGSTLGNAVAAADRDVQLVVGRLSGSGSEQFGGSALPAIQQERGFFATIEPAPEQDAYLLASAVNEPVAVMEQRITQRGGEVYRTVDLPDERIRFVGAFLTPELVLSLSGSFSIFVDLELVPNGTVSPSGWALEALNSAPSSAPFSYTYPETCHPTVLYLIDSAIDTSSGYFAGNPNLSFGISHLVRATGDPLVSTKFDHGTAMLSMIAGPTYGAAQGTPITVHNYDIYPDGATARLSALVEAIGLANTHKALNHPYDPAVYCIASSADDPGVKSPTLEPAIDYAISSSVYASVILSAGNTAGLAEDYVPSTLGSKAGVICAGAIDAANVQVPLTRGGSAVDVWAPGDSVDAAETSGFLTTFSGTSASTAFVTGAALMYLSGNPSTIPTTLETALVTTYSQSDTIGPIVSVPVNGIPGFTTFADWASWFVLTDQTTGGNDDGDSWSNEEEYIWGFDPTTYDYPGSLVTLDYDPGTTTFTFQFLLSCHLYQESTLTTYGLRDGTSLVIERSSDLDTWTDVTSSLTLTEVGHLGGQVTLAFDYLVTTSPCFFRVRVQ